ncbi:mucoidy inhibitor MuiA family protein [Kibdelosporangium philippinense]|uniref:Mucoidy inhibitor MuiA family protein n=1 Tax=Kibdelosporangium philippinense TaxID=211113 RepID=A0ABS8ZPB4_9PSEU|nr:mucoidy inhibitor MuiA family protein [Kibdelosporangium philippinense]MCE7009585.1 mucoidy inhibitor MuiA family protein [Kibdelosporangium philippinense]
MTVQAPIVAVTVYPGQARVTRRATVTLANNEPIEINGLPLSMQRDSVRVRCHGEARVVGVSLTTAHKPRSDDAKVVELEGKLRGLTNGLQELTDTVAVEDSRIELLTGLRRRAGGTFAKALAKGEIQPDRIADLTDSIGNQLADVLARKRELAQQRVSIQEELDAVSRELAALRTHQTPDQQAARVELEAADNTTVDIELSYVVNEASWTSSYDIRLDGESLWISWYAEITQFSGEDWPQCELALSTARPAVSVDIPELEPWYLDRVRPPAAPVPMMMAAEQAVYGAPGAVDAVMAVEHTTTAAIYRPTRPVAVPSDGTSHRATVHAEAVNARIDHITAPSQTLEAYIRATAVNTSEHTLLPGAVSIFHEGQFVGTTTLDFWSTGEEIELNLGIDDQIRVERKLVQQSASKAVTGRTKRRDAEYLITVGNYSKRPTKVTVLDQIPVSRDDGITVKDVSCKPEPGKRTDLGELTWELALEPGKTADIRVAFRVEVTRGVELQGWRE